MSNYYTKEPLIHSNITDELDPSHPLAFESVDCDKCRVALHADNNETMQTWVETEFGNYCTACFHFTDVMDDLEKNLGPV